MNPVKITAGAFVRPCSGKSGSFRPFSKDFSVEPPWWSWLRSGFWGFLHRVAQRICGAVSSWNHDGELRSHFTSSIVACKCDRKIWMVSCCFPFIGLVLGFTSELNSFVENAID